ncbi:unnamed protein product [Bemisia tabaci]|uniref:Secreted protein n=1 Tax=Bemisia tabaci TaxID=7038 RepID=A0A9P0AET0_BEMTA|nr:unnamed protein product [Bemisia tabaci]
MSYLRHLVRGYLTLLFLDLYVNATIVIPEEVPSFLSIVYSNIPPIKKGTDSRLGFGFRLGPNADVQIQLELGPQTNTQPIGPNAEAPAASKKRQTNQPPGNRAPAPQPPRETTKGQWIDSWQSTMADSPSLDKEKLLAYDPTKRQEGIVNHLRQLYKEIDNNKQTDS